MKNEFQSLSLDIFSQAAVTEPKFVYGGSVTTAPNGGCTCDTVGGNIHGVSYTSDTEAFNSNGTSNGKDYQGTSGT